MDSSNTTNLGSHLAKSLPESLSIEVFHLATPVVGAKSLFSSPPGQAPEPTTKESHFIAVSHKSILIFGIEIVVYVSVKSEKVTVFVSKADSSGHLPKHAASFTPKGPPSAPVSVLRTIATEAVNYVVDGYRQHAPSSTITVSLFARSQSQYLFPNSASNDKKHVLPDQGLIRWWCKVLDPILQENSATGAQAYALVPGSDRFQVHKLLPPISKTAWKHGHPFHVEPERDLTVREVIPHFPDDPKSRFLEELNGDSGDQKISKRDHKWKNVGTVDEFWELMSHRQECSLGRCVGFIWVVVPGKALGTTVADSAAKTPSLADSENSQYQSQEKEANSALPENIPLPRSPRKRPASHALGTLSPKKKRQKAPNLVEPAVRKTPIVKATITLDDKRYQRAVDSLLNHTDFGSPDDAKLSSTKWIQGVSAMWGNLDETTTWGITMKGQVPTCTPAEIQAARDADSNNLPRIEDIAQKPVNVLSVGLIRKKKKAV